ncbi:hypothetical protein NQ318_022343 [Aromia moschata]|uniref:Carboxylic ester hydrolase n=1 Tax=Aromia moschata TaxID=1265417 RepID=A0AAV8Z7B4_9CUCU|nr:hypothetical protein NQ318_022343 [Aromia moschata]
MILWITLLGLLAYSTAHCETTEAPLLTTPSGQLRGTRIISRLGRTIYSFIGIRYAEPPVGNLRFKPPVIINKWEGVYNATEDGPLCPQPWDNPTSEDCLFVNVYSTKLPKGPKNPKRPVVVHIPSGGFYSYGSASYLAGPNYFMDQDIVLVTFNYRLATLGFLSTGDKEAPGNLALKDQVVLLKWVKKNIAAFGGDPDNVTIMGSSAGGWSVILHMVSPMSEGLFHKGVSMSGSPIGCWPLKRNQLDLAQKQARFVGCPDDTAENIIKCLKTVPYKELADTLFKFSEFNSDYAELNWSPVIEEDFGQERFLPEHPIKLIVNGKLKKVPLIIGLTKDEFGFMAPGVLDNATQTKRLNDDFEGVAPIAFAYDRDTDHSMMVSRAIKKFYFNDKPLDKSQVTPLAELFQDSIEGFPINRAARLISQYSSQPVYYYHFSYQGQYSHVYLPGSNGTKPAGVVHEDDLLYLLYIARLFPLFKKDTPKEVEMVNKLTTIYANFAKTGKPIPTPTEGLDNVNWEPFTLKDHKYLDIGKKLVIKERLHEARYNLWDKLYPIEAYLH